VRNSIPRSSKSHLQFPRPIGRVLLLAIFASHTACTTVPARPEQSIAQSTKALLRGFSDEAELEAYLSQLMALEFERSAYVRRQRAKSRKLARIETAAAKEILLSEKLAGMDIEEILISGEQQNTLQSAPTSSTSFSAGDLQALRIEDIADLANYTPNLSTASDPDSITNNQEIGVDEGDIVKRVGDYVILLRRGRLFSFDIGAHQGDPLRVVDRIDLPAKQLEGDSKFGTWYDELLVKGSTLIVIGYNYELDATEIARFEFSAEGQFSRREAIYLTAFDYYDSSNYASRIVNGELVLYSPVHVEVSSQRDAQNRVWVDGANVDWPMRVSFSPSGKIESITPLIVDMRIYAGFQSPGRWPVIHTVLRCPLDEAEFQCVAAGILGPDSETHYISTSGFYLWIVSDDWVFNVDELSPFDYRTALEAGDVSPHSEIESSVIYRIPLEFREANSLPGAVEVRGFPGDQFAFREAGEALDLFAIREELLDEVAPREERYETSAMLIQIPLDAFSAGLWPWSKVQRQELPLDSTLCLTHRFIGEHLVYTECESESDGVRGRNLLRVKRIGDDRPPIEIELVEVPERIESLRDSAIIAGFRFESPNWNADPVEFRLSSLQLEPTPEIVDSLVVESFVPEETRSHAFNFSRFGEDRIMALPLTPIETASPRGSKKTRAPMEIHYFGMRPNMTLYPMGAVSQSASALTLDDHCRISCEDWYGAARPFFIGKRIFGLIDYELIEARAFGEEIIELDRTSAMPW
jgi:hypothetical protein